MGLAGSAVTASGFVESGGRDAAAQLDLIAELAARTVAHWVGPGRDRMLARYEISLESVRRPTLRAELLSVGAAIRERTASAFAALGAPEPDRQGRDFIACVDGLIYDQLAGAGGVRSAEDVRRTLREFLGGIFGGSR